MKSRLSWVLAGIAIAVAIGVAVRDTRVRRDLAVEPVGTNPEALEPETAAGIGYRR
jgi:hypothetical protein